jgi:hypothetical protein
MSTERIKVCVRLRPLLAPYEDEEVWGTADDNQGRIFSLNAGGPPGSSPNYFGDQHAFGGLIGANLSNQVNINALIREKDLRRRYQD